MDTVQAVFERGVFKPLESVELQEGQSVLISFAPRGLTREPAEAELAEMARIDNGLSEEDIEEIERIRLDRSSFMRPVEAP